MSDDNFTAVEVLIARMETNPDEFLRGGRLGYVADAIYEAALSPKLESERLWFLKDAEKIKLIAAYREYCRARFQEELFVKLFEEKTEVLQTNLTPLNTLMEKQQALLQQEYKTRMAREYEKQRAACVGVFTAAGAAVQAIPTTSNPAYNAWPGGLLTTGGLK